MARVIIVSNRLPVSVKKVDGKLEFGRSIGGIATGLSSYMRDRNNRWIGWPGIPSEDLNDAEKHQITTELRKHNCSPVFLTRRQVDDFYNGFSNSILWPMYHNLPYKDPSPAVRERWWRAYREVNHKFADAALDLAEHNSRIWVHDYQLLLVPEYIRRQNNELNIGYFHHITFPEPKMYGKLPEAKRLITGMAGASLIGFHTSGYVHNFLDNCLELGIGAPARHQLIVGARTVRVIDFPMGIDYPKYAAAFKTSAVKAAVRKYKQRYKHMQVIVAIDRLDLTKGLAERLKAYRTFLETYPKWQGKVVFSMVAAPSRTDIPAYQSLGKQLNKLAAEINGQFGTAKWQPIDYINVALPFEEVTALFQIANIAFIAPLIDGMNLAAKEYVASRRKRGVLILSETAGAARELTDALLVNPRKPETVVRALDHALNMPKRELRYRFKQMKKHLSSNTVQSWAGNFMNTLQQPVPGTPNLVTYTLSERRQKQLRQAYRQATRRLLLLDYDGTLVQFSANYQSAEPAAPLINLLKRLSDDKQNDIVLISGRSKDDLEAWFGMLPINLVAEHGALVRTAGHKTWRETIESGRRWKQLVRPVFEKYAALTPRSRVEEKQYSMVWHYRQSPPYYAQKYAVILQRVLRPLLKPFDVTILAGNKILEVKDPNINKGRTLQRWLKRDYDFTLAAGDDFTDEDTFQAAPADAYTVKVGRGRTAANYRLAHPEDVLALIKTLTR